MAEGGGVALNEGARPSTQDNSRNPIKWDRFVLPVIFCVVVLVFYALDQRFLSPLNITNILNQVSILMVVTVAASIVIFLGGFDLSAGTVVALAGVVTAVVVEQTGNVGLALCCGLLLGIAVGSINGFFVSVLRVSPLIVTLGMMNAARGLALILAGGSAVYSFPTWFTDFGTSRILGLPTLFVIAAAIFLVFAAILRFTTYGVAIYATGGNEAAARLSGINVTAVRFTGFAIAGALAAVGGMMLTARTGGGEPTAGHLYELEAIAAVVLGGAALSGGEGRLWRSMLGILLLAALGNGLNIVGVHPHWKGVAIGAILVLAASLDALRRRN